MFINRKTDCINEINKNIEGNTYKTGIEAQILCTITALQCRQLHND